jgi:predicted secreted protein
MAVAGKNASFEIVSGTTAYAIQGLNNGSITVNGETIDVTTFASGGWIEKIKGLGSAEISLEGFWLAGDTNGQDALRSALLNGTTATMKALLDGTSGWTGDFLVTSFEDGAEVSGEVSRSMSLESTGAITVV